MAAKYKILSTKILAPSLVEQAERQAIDIIEQPFISIHPVTDSRTGEEILLRLNQPAPFYAVFTSANAVEAIAPFLKSAGKTPNWKLFCIEGRTRRTLTALTAPENILETAEYGRELAEKILRHPVKEVVFFCGNRRREELPSILKQKGVSVHEIVVYHTVNTPAQLTGSWDGILFFSPSAVDSFFSVNHIDKHTICFAIGQTTADSIARHTGNTIVVSGSTGQSAILEGVRQYFNDNMNAIK